jgi:hypothetical protein
MTIDVLSQTSAESAYFETNTAVEKVPLTYGSGKMYDANYMPALFSKDHFILLSMGVVLPLGFELYNVDYQPPNGEPPTGLPIVGAYHNELPVIELSMVNDGETPEAANIFQKLYLPFLNYELSIGKYFQVPNVVTALKYNIYANFLNTSLVYISMLGVPEALNEKIFQVPIFIKILHTLNMQSGESAPC